MGKLDDDDYQNPDLLWSREMLHERLDDPSLRLIDVRPGERFAMGHIPGARHFDIYAVNCDDTDDARIPPRTAWGGIRRYNCLLR
jgi:3-mercaptopyruvate sulfurtransferase SseA